MEVEAEVQECIKPTARPFYDPPYYDEAQLLGGENLIIFAYSVGDETYTGMLSSKDEVQKGDKFPIKCNPRNPEKNNSIDSQFTWTVEYTVALSVFLIVLFAGYFMWTLLAHR